MTRSRIILVGTGQYGLEAARIAIGKGYDLVAVYNRAGPKVGQDIGRLAALGREVGVIVEDIEGANITRHRADAAIVAVSDRLAVNLPHYTQLLGAGVNVVCHGAEAYFPWVADRQSAEVIDALAKANGVSFTGTGIWDFSRIWAGIAMCGPATEIRKIYHRALTDAQSATAQLARVCGVGMSQAEFGSDSAQLIGGFYSLPAQHVLTGLGYDITSVTEHREPVFSDQPVYSHILDETLEPGRVLGIRIVSEVETAQGVTGLAHSELRILAEGENEHMFWKLEGRPETSVRVERSDSVHMSAACLVNRVPDIIAAAPGVRLLSELGPLLPRLAG